MAVRIFNGRDSDYCGWQQVKGVKSTGASVIDSATKVRFQRTDPVLQDGQTATDSTSKVTDDGGQTNRSLFAGIARVDSK